MITENSKCDLIISHGHCPDGWLAALIASWKFPTAEIMFRDHGLEPPYKHVEGRNVIVTDFSWRTREQNDALAKLAKSFLILDHHKTAQAVLQGAPYAVFDMERSGAGLAWDYIWGKDSNYHNELNAYNPTGLQNAPPLKRPWYVNYIETCGDGLSQIQRK